MAFNKTEVIIGVVGVVVSIIGIVLYKRSSDATNATDAQNAANAALAAQQSAADQSALLQGQADYGGGGGSGYTGYAASGSSANAPPIVESTFTPQGNDPLASLLGNLVSAGTIPAGAASPTAPGGTTSPGSTNATASGPSLASLGYTGAPGELILADPNGNVLPASGYQTQAPPPGTLAINPTGGVNGGASVFGEYYAPPTNGAPAGVTSVLYPTPAGVLGNPPYVPPPSTPAPAPVATTPAVPDFSSFFPAGMPLAPPIGVAGIVNTQATPAPAPAPAVTVQPRAGSAIIHGIIGKPGSSSLL